MEEKLEVEELRLIESAEGGVCCEKTCSRERYSSEGEGSEGP